MNGTVRSFGLKQGLLVLAAGITAAIHLGLGLQFKDTLFLLNAVGFVGLTAAYLLPWRFLDRTRAWARWALIGFSALTIILWVVINGKPDVIGLTAKAAEVVIIAVLLLNRKRQ
jgi:hypothetical protein